MKITLTPVFMETPLRLERKGDDTLVFNQVEVDLTDPDLDCEWVVGSPTLGPDGWEITIVLPHGSDAPHETRFPEPIEVTEDGVVNLPPYEVTTDGPDL